MNRIGRLGNRCEFSDKCSVTICDKRIIFIGADLFIIFCPCDETIPVFGCGGKRYGTSLLIFTPTAGGPSFGGRYVDGIGRLGSRPGGRLGDGFKNCCQRSVVGYCKC